MDLWIGAINLGILYAFMALGTYITYKLYDFPDITIDGTFTTGAAVSGILIIGGWNPFLVLPVAFLAGAMAGVATGFIHTRFRIEGLLAGILVMTALYSINLHIMGRSNVPLLDTANFLTPIMAINPGLPAELWNSFFLIPVIAIAWFMLTLFLKTDFGLTMRATGNNPVMVSAQGVSVDRMKMFGIAMANGLAALSGAMVAQYQGFADIGMGIGSIIFSLASVIIGEALFRSRSLWIVILSVIAGSIIFRLAVAAALNVGMNPNDLKLVTAAFVLLTLVFSNTAQNRPSGFIHRMAGKLNITQRQLQWIMVAFVAVMAGAFLSVPRLFHANEKKKTSIGIIITNNSDLLMKTRDGLIDELHHLGYIHGENCVIYERNAEGEIPANKTIVDNYITRGVDLFVPISTASLQATLNKVKDKPVVFATVANPFAIGAGTTPFDHPANVTGVYGSSPMKELLSVYHQFYPGKSTIGTIYNPAYPNTVANLGDLKKALIAYPEITLEEVTIEGSGDVYQAAVFLASKRITAFVLINDLTVFNSFESVVRASRNNRIPIFTCDTERLRDGALAVYGYDYYGSGVQAAHLVDRVLKGELPAGIPYEKYRSIVRGINYDVAAAYGINIPAGVQEMPDVVVRGGKLIRQVKPENKP